MMLLKTLLAIALAWGTFAGFTGAVQDSNPIPPLLPLQLIPTCPA